MRSKFSILLAVLALIASTLACAAGQMSLDNPRMAKDEAGAQATTTYGANDVFHVVADLNNATKGTTIEAKWYTVNVPGVDAGPIQTDQASTLNIEDDYFSGYVTFQLSSATPWPAGEYKAELYLNGTLTHTVNFTVQ